MPWTVVSHAHPILTRSRALGAAILGVALLAPATAEAEEVPADFSPEITREILGFDDFTYDSGWIPDGSPVQMRFELHAGNTIDISMPGEGVYEWDAYEIRFDGSEDAGSFTIDLGVELGAKVKVDIDILDVETDLFGPFDLASISTTMFTPYLLMGNPDRPAEISDATQYVTIAEIPLTPSLLGLAEGQLDIDMSIEVEGNLVGNRIEVDVAAPFAQQDQVDSEGQQVFLDPGEGPEPDPFEVDGTLVCHLETTPVVWIKPTLVIETFFEDYVIADIEIPVDLPAFNDDLIFDTLQMAFARPEPEPEHEPEPETTEGPGSDSDSDSDSNTGTGTGTSMSGGDSDTIGETTGGIGTETFDSFGDSDSGTGEDEEGGCGCRTEPSGGLPASLLSLFGLLAFRRRPQA